MEYYEMIRIWKVKGKKEKDWNGMGGNGVECKGKRVKAKKRSEMVWYLQVMSYLKNGELYERISENDWKL